MTTVYDAIVVGSGPSGTAAARALINRGVRPLVIDGGLDASPAAVARAKAVRSGGEAETPNQKFTQKNPGQKDWFGSAASFEQSERSTIRYADSVVARASFARGGFSRVWGATNAFFREYDGWGADVRPTDEDLAVVRDIAPVSKTDWNGGDSQEHAVVGAARSLVAMRSFQRRGGRWTIEASEVAIESDPRSDRACQLDGRCLSGCPFDSIWFSGSSIEEWSHAGLLEYRAGLVAESVIEEGDLSRIRATDARGVLVTLDARRTYIAAGAISTAAILIGSDRFESLRIPDTSTAFLGVVAARPQGPRGGRHHGLSQWWIRSTEDRGFLAQVYPPSPEHARRIQDMLPGGRLLAGPAQFAAGRLHPVIAYLHSDKSDPLTISRDGRGAKVTGDTTRATKAAFSHYLRQLSADFLRAGYVLPMPAVEFSAPGTGYHFGSSLPHSSGTDSLGRLPGWSRTHVVDSSVLPSLEVGSITPTVMANSARIARSSAALA